MSVPDFCARSACPNLSYCEPLHNHEKGALELSLKPDLTVSANSSLSVNADVNIDAIDLEVNDEVNLDDNDKPASHLKYLDGRSSYPITKF